MAQTESARVGGEQYGGYKLCYLFSDSIVNRGSIAFDCDERALLGHPHPVTPSWFAHCPRPLPAELKSCIKSSRKIIIALNCGRKFSPRIICFEHPRSRTKLPEKVTPRISVRQCTHQPEQPCTPRCTGFQSVPLRRNVLACAGSDPFVME